MKLGTGLRRAGCSMLAGIAALSLSSVAHGDVLDLPEGERPMAMDWNAGLPDSGGNANELFGARTVFDEPAPLPSHPPIDQIPMMPMPEPVFAPGVQSLDDRMVFHDALTGETRMLQQQMPSGLSFASSPEGDYLGVGISTFAQDEGVRGFGNMFAASGLDSSPRSYNVKLIMRFTDQNGIQRWFACSGSMQDPGVVLTAAHCVYARSPNGINIFDWADIVYIYPGWDGNSNNGPFGQPDSDEVIQNWGYAYGSSYIAGSDYVNNGNFDRDCGLIRITRGGSRSVGMLTGWYAWAWGGSCATIQSRTYNNFSYPAENCPTAGLHTGRTMYYWSGTVDDCPNNQMQLNTGGNCLDTVWGGMSGSAMYYIDGGSRYAHSVCSTSNRNDRGYYCKLWEGFVTDMQSFENNTRTSDEDWEPMMMRANGSTTVQAGTAMDADMSVRMVNATNADPAPQDYVLRVYLSTNNNISTADTQLATWNWSNRDFGAMGNVNFTVPAPFIPIDTPPGTYWIGVIADSGIPGTDTNDDTDTWDAQQITVTLGLPGQAGIVSPSNGATGVDINADVDWTAGARATSSTLYFGTDPTPDSGEFVVSTVGTSWSLPALEENTQYYWRVDSNNSSGTTTGAVWSFRTEVFAPDLRAAVCEYDDAAVYFPGSTIWVTHRTYNDGPGVASGVHLDFYASTNNFISSGDNLIGTRDYGSLNIGSSHWFTSSLTIPASLSPGTYWVGYIASDDDGLDTNTGNNWIAGTLPITVSDCVADFNGDGTLDIFDVFNFLDAFNSGQGAADLNNDGVWDIFDVFIYLDLFNAGCA